MNGAEEMNPTERLDGLDDLKGKIGQSNDVLEAGYVALNLNKIAKAYDKIPCQLSLFTCSVNSAARALALAGVDINKDNYVGFVHDCHTRLTTIRNLLEGLAISLCTSGILACILSAIPGGQDIGMTIAAYSFYFAAYFMVVRVPVKYFDSVDKCGIGIWEICNHMNLYLTGAYRCSYVAGYNDFSEYEAAVAQDIANNQPVIAVFFTTPTVGHVANIVAIKKEENGSIGEFIMMDTSYYEKRKFFEIIPHDEMEYLTNNNYKIRNTLAFWRKPWRTYYLIRFQKKNGNRKRRI